MLMIPDYFHYLLTGVQKFEYTNASSTGLLDAENQTWDFDLIRRLGFPRRLFPPLSKPGTIVGTFSQEIQDLVGFNCTVVLPATHDTGSAFVAVPAKGQDSVCLSSGTWSLLGVELEHPNTTDASRIANFTNEGGYNGRYRYLKNIMGLWMIQELRREYGTEHSFSELIALAEAAAFSTVIDVNDPGFLAPASMAQAIQTFCNHHALPAPQGMGETLKCVYQSLAVCYRNAIEELSRLTKCRYAAIHIVGGGSHAEYLNRLTAQATGLPVYAGPTEATALGNLIVQMIAAGCFRNLTEARQAIYESFEIKEVLP